MNEEPGEWSVPIIGKKSLEYTIKTKKPPIEYPNNMTKKEWRHQLALAAMASFNMVAPPEQIAKWAYERADAMLKEGGEKTYEMVAEKIQKGGP